MKKRLASLEELKKRAEDLTREFLYHPDPFGRQGQGLRRRADNANRKYGDALRGAESPL